jgi:hypothetical protein
MALGAGGADGFDIANLRISGSISDFLLCTDGRTSRV